MKFYRKCRGEAIAFGSEIFDTKKTEYCENGNQVIVKDNIPHVGGFNIEEIYIEILSLKYHREHIIIGTSDRLDVWI